jgi:RimJ/RimL family protein N-acetyltransferase
MIKGKKVILRPVTEKDFTLLHKWINNPAVLGFWYGKDKLRSMKWVKDHFLSIIKNESNSSCWIIEVSGEPIGFMYNTICKDDDKFTGRVELDILIGDDKKRGKGYGADALKAMIYYAFKVQKAQRVYLTPHIKNVRAIHVYEKVGFKKEGILRSFEKFEGKWIDCVMMSIIKGEFKY